MFKMQSQIKIQGSQAGVLNEGSPTMAQTFQKDDMTDAFPET